MFRLTQVEGIAASSIELNRIVVRFIDLNCYAIESMDA